MMWWLAPVVGFMLGWAIVQRDEHDARQRAEIIRLETEKCNAQGGFYAPETGCQILKRPIVEYMR